MREERRRQREERRREKKERKRSTAKNDDSDGEVDTAMLHRQGYRGQFEKDLARATALRRLVDLDDTSAVVVDLGPQTEYDMYIRNFGSSGLTQVGVQAPCEEDYVSTEVQAERVKTKNRSAQVPGDLGLYPEREAERNAFRLKGSGTTDREQDDEEDGGERKKDHQPPSVDAGLLASFLSRVYPVLGALMDEGASAAAVKTDKKSKGATSFSSSYTTLLFAGTRNRKVRKTVFSQANTQHLAVLYGSSEELGSSPQLDRFTSVILVWKARDPSAPEHLLVSSSEIRSICWSPSRPYILYAGTEDGCVVLWDLREPDRYHLNAGRYQKLVFRVPSFTTAWMTDNHVVPVCDVRVAGYNTPGSPRREEMEQLLSLDVSGVTRFWALNEKDTPKANISENDYGLNPLSTVRLYPANTYRTNRRGEEEEDPHTAGGAGGALDADTALCIRAHGVDFSPVDPSHYLVAMADGVRHVSRFSSVASPALYGPSTHYFETPVVVPSCLQFNTVDTRVFIAGYEDGTVRLYLTTESHPQLTVPLGGGAIVDVRPSLSSKWLTWALDDTGTIHLLDHAHRDRHVPLLSQPLNASDTGLCTALDTPSEEKADVKLLVLGFEKGMVQVHTLDNEKLQTPSSQRDENWL
ncbi:WDdomain 60 [Angomonas deanei]|uniref:WD domain, G-beta repeat, putative n=1 Tax=Angomonas deanei TaxID=59799 RepID=A0A7G2CRH6_9TRYP|nr:WDdomain 60 [Angomonas deanei]CAD2222350.1 WD domain, G-beta repeat, putative [Angomonas deanei]|eukprot:EPY41238.1 WDdomain 60 [Angomonas deanei]